MRWEPMTEERYQTYVREQIASYAGEIERSGLPRAEAVREAEESTARLLPQGLHTPDHHLFVAFDGDEEVAQMWLEVTDQGHGRHAFVYALDVREDRRRRGYGRATMELAEQWCRDQGVTRIGLHVFAHNPGARRLYEQLGFVETGRSMRKTLTAG